MFDTSHPLRWPRLTPEVLAVAALLVAASVLLGRLWPRFAVLTTWGSGTAGTPWTTLALSLVAVAVLVPGAARRWTASLAAAMGALAVVSPVAVRTLQRLVWASAPARPAIGVGVGVLLLAVAAWTTVTPVTVTGVPTALAAGAAAIANLSLYGRLTHDPWLASAGDAQGAGAMSLPAIVMILLLAAALWLRDDPPSMPLLIRTPARQPILAASVFAVGLPLTVALWPGALPRVSTGYAVVALLVVAATMAAQLAAAAAHQRDAMTAIVAVVDVSPDALLFFDPAGTIVGANPAVETLFGLDGQQLEGSPVDRLLPFLRPPAVPASRRGRRPEPASRVRHAVAGHRVDGTTFPAEVWLSPVRLQGQPITAASVRDTTLHEQQVRQLETIRDLQDIVLLAISHELRTPLTVVSGLVDTLVAHGDELDDARRHDLVLRLAAQTRRFTALVGQLLDIDRLRDGVAPRAARVDLRPVVQDQARESADHHQLDVTVDVATTVPHVRADPVLIARIIDNLLANAAKYAPGPVEVRLAAVNDGVEIVVEDHGPGIPPALRDQIFEPFRRGDQIDPSSPGLGLGLTLVTRVAAAVGGRTWVQDRTDNRSGASFHVHLPAA